MRRVAGLRTNLPLGGYPKRSVAPQFVRLTAYDKRHRLSCFKGCFEELIALNDLDPETAATPLKAEAKAAATGRQLRVEGDAVCSESQACKTEQRGQPDPAEGR